MQKLNENELMGGKSSPRTGRPQSQIAHYFSRLQSNV